jgi:hypothetical protein
MGQMETANTQSQHGMQLVAFLAITVLTVYQMARILVFMNAYGGIEHDGGWALGVSRSLAEKGTYTSMVSTIENPEVVGGLSVNGHYEIQDRYGGIWFRISDVAATSIVVNALVIRLFGSSYWALVAGPLAFFFLFLVIAALLLHRVAGFLPVALFHGFIFCYPNLSIFLSYQALREVPAMAMVLVSLLLFSLALNRTRQTSFLLFCAGLFAGFAVNAKVIAALSLAGIFLWVLVLLIWGNPRLRLCHTWPLAAGFVLVPAFWEVYQWHVLTKVAGIESYWLRTEERLRFMLDGGSGLREKTHAGIDFLTAKLGTLSNISGPEFAMVLVVLLILGLGGLATLRILRHQRVKAALFGPLWVAWLINSAWFFGMAKNSWPRHYWFGMIEAILLIVAMPAILWDYARTRIQEHSCLQGDVGRCLFWKKASCVLATIFSVFLLVLIIFNFVSQPYVWHLWLPDEIVSSWRDKQLGAHYGNALPWIIVPTADQQAAVEFIRDLPPEANVYYPPPNKGAELPPLTGRMHYPLGRRGLLGNPRHSDDVVLVPSSLISPWQEPGKRQAILRLVHEACPQPLLENEYYIICRADDIRPLP